MRSKEKSEKLQKHINKYMSSMIKVTHSVTEGNFLFDKIIFSAEFSLFLHVFYLQRLSSKLIKNH